MNIVTDLIAPALTPRPTAIDLMQPLFGMCSTMLAVRDDTGNTCPRCSQVGQHGFCSNNDCEFFDQHMSGIPAEGPICKECGYEVGSIDAKNCWHCDPNYEPTDAQIFSHSEAAREQIAASRERDREAWRLKR